MMIPPPRLLQIGKLYSFRGKANSMMLVLNGTDDVQRAETAYVLLRADGTTLEWCHRWARSSKWYYDDAWVPIESASQQ
jgi:hypothetical protein